MKSDLCYHCTEFGLKVDCPQCAAIAEADNTPDDLDESIRKLQESLANIFGNKPKPTRSSFNFEKAFPYMITFLFGALTGVGMMYGAGCYFQGMC